MFHVFRLTQSSSSCRLPYGRHRGKVGLERPSKGGDPAQGRYLRREPLDGQLVQPVVVRCGGEHRRLACAEAGAGGAKVAARLNGKLRLAARPGAGGRAGREALVAGGLQEACLVNHHRRRLVEPLERGEHVNLGEGGRDAPPARRPRRACPHRVLRRVARQEEESRLQVGRQPVGEVCAPLLPRLPAPLAAEDGPVVVGAVPGERLSDAKHDGHAARAAVRRGAQRAKLRKKVAGDDVRLDTPAASRRRHRGRRAAARR
mmetsp:Transcript_19051/g.62908  ORF Transcript_19051/g.62908 Transcript_19051/m.62908 type:complete len:260 (-) Transcript_19051:249-1028(-)